MCGNRCQILVLVAIYVIGTSARPQDIIPLSEQELEAARRAHYDFSTDIKDEVNDLSQHRKEIRQGGTVQGSYGYSDGHLRRNVTYVADENGFRILSDDVEELPGPNVKSEGITSVNTHYDGAALEYKVKQYRNQTPQTADYVLPS